MNGWKVKIHTSFMQIYVLESIEIAHYVKARGTELTFLTCQKYLSNYKYSCTCQVPIRTIEPASIYMANIECKQSQDQFERLL